MKHISKQISVTSTYTSLVCAMLLGVGIFYLPILYYTILKIIITIGALLLSINNILKKEYLWAAVFLTIAILFNPFFSVYLSLKPMSIWIELLVGLLFLLNFRLPTSTKKKNTNLQQTSRKHNRDKIYSSNTIL